MQLGLDFVGGDFFIVGGDLFIFKFLELRFAEEATNTCDLFGSFQFFS